MVGGREVEDGWVGMGFEVDTSLSVRQLRNVNGDSGQNEVM